METITEKKKNKKIVLAEDDSLMSSVLATHLIKEGFSIVSVKEGGQAFERIKAEQPDIVLLDLVLPGVSGFDILQKLKQDPSTQSIPVLILSNLGSKEDIQRGLDLGAVAYLVKANSMVEEITAKVNAIIKQQTTSS